MQPLNSTSEVKSFELQIPSKRVYSSKSALEYEITSDSYEPNGCSKALLGCIVKFRSISFRLPTKDELRWPLQAGASAGLASFFLSFLEPSRLFFGAAGVIGPVIAVVALEATAGGALRRAWLIAICSCVGALAAYALFTLCIIGPEGPAASHVPYLIFLSAILLTIPAAFFRFNYPTAVVGVSMGLSTAETVLLAAHGGRMSEEPWKYASKRALSSIIGSLCAVLATQCIMVKAARPTAANSLAKILSCMGEILVPLASLDKADVSSDGGILKFTSSSALLLSSYPRLLASVRRLAGDSKDIMNRDLTQISNISSGFDPIKPIYVTVQPPVSLDQSPTSTQVVDDHFNHELKLTASKPSSAGHSSANYEINQQSHDLNYTSTVTKNRIVGEEVPNTTGYLNESIGFNVNGGSPEETVWALYEPQRKQCEAMMQNVTKCQTLLRGQKSLVESAAQEISWKKPHRFPKRKYNAILAEIETLFFHIASLVFSVNLYISTVEVPSLNTHQLSNSPKYNTHTKVYCPRSPSNHQEESNKCSFGLSESHIDPLSRRRTLGVHPSNTVNNLSIHRSNIQAVIPQNNTLSPSGPYVKSSALSSPCSPHLNIPTPVSTMEELWGNAEGAALGRVARHISQALQLLADCLRNRHKASVAAQSEIAKASRAIADMESQRREQRTKFADIILTTLEADVTGIWSKDGSRQLDWVAAIGLDASIYRQLNDDEKLDYWVAYWLGRDRISCCSSTLNNLRDSLVRCSSLLDDYIGVALKDSDAVFQLLP